MSIKVERAFIHKVSYAVSVYTIIHWSYREGGLKMAYHLINEHGCDHDAALLCSACSGNLVAIQWVVTKTKDISSICILQHTQF